MPQEGFKAVTISEDLWKQLKERAEKEGLSLPQLVEQYMTHAHSVNDLLYLNDPQAVRARIDQIAQGIRGIIVNQEIKEKAREWKKKYLAGEVDSETLPTFTEPESTQLQNNALETALEIAQYTIEKNRESFEEFKQKDIENKLKIYVLNNKETLKREFEQLAIRAENLASQKKGNFSYEQIMEFGDIAKKREDLKKYLPYLPETVQNVDEKTEKILKGDLNG